MSIDCIAVIKAAAPAVSRVVPEIPDPRADVARRAPAAAASVSGQRVLGRE